jgi:acetylornithine deacetylase/succinyl-diaminopimelate desuccinylase-like protein
MNTRLKGGTLSAIPGGNEASGAENAKKLLEKCLKSIHEATKRYDYDISAEEILWLSLNPSWY